MRLKENLLSSQTQRNACRELLDRFKSLNLDCLLREVGASKARVKINLLQDDSNITSNALRFAWQTGYDDCIADILGLEKEMEATENKPKPTRKMDFGSADILKGTPTKVLKVDENGKSKR